MKSVIPFDMEKIIETCRKMMAKRKIEITSEVDLNDGDILMMQGKGTVLFLFKTTAKLSIVEVLEEHKKTFVGGVLVLVVPRAVSFTVTDEFETLAAKSRLRDVQWF